MRVFLIAPLALAKALQAPQLLEAGCLGLNTEEGCPPYQEGCCDAAPFWRRLDYTDTTAVRRNVLTTTKAYGFGWELDTVETRPRLLPSAHNLEDLVEETLTGTPLGYCRYQEDFPGPWLPGAPAPRTNALGAAVMHEVTSACDRPEHLYLAWQYASVLPQLCNKGAAPGTRSWLGIINSWSLQGARCALDFQDCRATRLLFRDVYDERLPGINRSADQNWPVDTMLDLQLANDNLLQTLLDSSYTYGADRREDDAWPHRSDGVSLPRWAATVSSVVRLRGRPKNWLLASVLHR